MSTPVTVYDNTTGKIVADDIRLRNPNDVSLQAESGQTSIAEESDKFAEYFPSGVRTSRPALSVPTSQNVVVDADLTLTGIPDSTDVYTDGVLVGTTDGSDIVLTFPEARVWRVRLEPPFPTRTAHIEVTAT